MAYPFRPLSTKKLKTYFKKFIDGNCNNQETNQNRKKTSGTKPKCSRRVLKTWIQQQMSSKV
jgi:hypothetical protein